MSTSRGFPPQLRLSIPPSTTSFKRSFEQFGFDLDDSPTHNNGGSDSVNLNGSNGGRVFHQHSSLVGMGGSGSTTSSRRDNDRNKRARSASSGPVGLHGESSRRATDSLAQSSTSLSAASSSSNPAPASSSQRPSLELPPRLPTPDIDVDMPDVDGDVGLNFSVLNIPSASNTFAPTTPLAGGSADDTSSLSTAGTLPEPYRLTLQGLTEEASPTSPPVLPPLQLETEEEGDAFAIALSGTQEGAPEAERTNGDHPPRIHIDLPQSSLTTLVTPEHEQDQNEGEAAPVTLPFSPHPPTLPPIPTTELLIVGADDPEPNTTTVPPQRLDDHIPPSPSLHELRRWIDDAASPAAQSDDSGSGLARSDVADAGTSQVVTHTSELRAPPPTFQEPDSWREFLSLSGRVPSRLDDHTNGVRRASAPRTEPTTTSSATTSGVDPWFPIPRRRRRPLSSALGTWDFDLDDGEPIVNASSASASSSSQALPGPGARLTRTLSLASHLHNRVLRRRLSLFEDEEDDIEGDYDEVVPSPVGRAVASPPRYSAASPSVPSITSQQWFRPLEVDLGPRPEPSSEQSEARPQQNGPSRAHRISVESSEDSSSSDESEPAAPSVSTPFTFSSSARLPMIGTNSFGPTATMHSVHTPSSRPGTHRHYHPQQVAFRPSSSRLVDDSAREARERDLRVYGLGAPPSSTSTSISDHRPQSDLHRPQFLSNLVTDRSWFGADRESTASSVGATAGSSTEDVRMQVDDDVEPPSLDTFGASPLTNVSSRYPNASRFLTSLGSSSASSSPSERPPSNIYQPPQSRYLADYDRSNVPRGVVPSGSAAGNGSVAHSRPEDRTFTAPSSSYLPEPALPSPHFDLSFTHDTTSTSAGGFDTVNERSSNNETQGPPPAPFVESPQEERSALADFLRGAEGGSLDTGFLDERFGERERDRQRELELGLGFMRTHPLPSSVANRSQQSLPPMQDAHRQHPHLSRWPSSFHPTRAEVPRPDSLNPGLRAAVPPSTSTARSYGVDVEMESNESFNGPYSGRLASYHSDSRSSYRSSSYMGTSSTGPSTTAHQVQQPATSRPTPNTSNTNTDARSGQDSSISSLFTPGPYRNTMRLLELQQQQRSASEEARTAREQSRSRFHGAYLPFRPTGESSVAIPPRPPSPAPILPHPPRDFEYNFSINPPDELLGLSAPSPPVRPPSPAPSTYRHSLQQPSYISSTSTYESNSGVNGPSFTPARRASSLFDYLSSRTGLRQPDNPPLYTSNSSTSNPTPTEPTVEARARNLLARIGASDSSSANSARHSGYEGIDYHSNMVRQPPPPPTPSASTMSATRRFEASEQTRPFNQAIEALREPTSNASTNSPSSSSPSSPFSAMELLRRRRLAGAAPPEDNGPGESSSTRSVRNASRRARAFSSEARYNRRLFGFSMGDFMRDEDFDNSYEGLLSLGSIVGDAKPRGTPSDVVDSMDKAKYRDWANADSDKRCPICLDDYEPSDPVMKLSHCSHWLHQDCLNQWLQSASTCPVCRKKATSSSPSLRPEPGPSRIRQALGRRMPRRLDPESAQASSSNTANSTSSNNSSSGPTAGPSNPPSDSRSGLPPRPSRLPELEFFAREGLENYFRRLRRGGPDNDGPPSF